jgi:hypothetical protein
MPKADTLPEVPADKVEDLRQLVEAILGFVYMGDGTEAVVKTIRVLRADPELAARLLG